MTRQDYEDVVVSVAHPPGRKSGSGVALERRAYVEAPDASHAGSDSRMRGEAQVPRDVLQHCSPPSKTWLMAPNTFSHASILSGTKLSWHKILA